MQDFLDPPPPSVAKPVLYGLGLGLGAMAIFVVAYLVAPNLGLAGTFAIAGVLAVLALVGLNAVPFTAAQEVTALARGEDVAAFPAEAGARPAPRPVEVRIQEHEARAAELRRETDTLDRATRHDEWFGRVRDLADELKALATLELSGTNRKLRRNGLAHLRQAASLYRRIVSSRGQSRSRRDWGTAQLALGECLLVLGEAEGARDEVMEAANAFTAGLDEAEIDGEERDAGQNGLARAEGVLASMAEATHRHGIADNDLL